MKHNQFRFVHAVWMGRSSVRKDHERADPSHGTVQPGKVALWGMVILSLLGFAGCSPAQPRQPDPRITSGADAELFKAVTRGDSSQIARALQDGANIQARHHGLMAAGSLDGATPLYFATHDNNPEIVALLLTLGADPSLPNLFGETPLQLAEKRDFAEIVRILTNHRDGTHMAPPTELDRKTEANSPEDARMAPPQTIDLEVGTIQLPAGFSERRTGTRDSRRGEITRNNPGLVIAYDIGKMAGLHMHPEKKDACLWFKEEMMAGQKCYMGMEQKGTERVLTISIVPPDGQLREPWTYPANFQATVRTDEDLERIKQIAFSYSPKEVRTGASPSKGFQTEIKELLDSHVNLLETIDRKKEE